MIPSPIHGPAAPRTPPEAVRALIASMIARVPALRDADARLCDLILPAEDLEATTRFVPGAGLLEGPFGRAINAALKLPADDRPWQVALRADVHREGGIDFLSWQTINVVESRADREEHVHLYSVITTPEGADKLAVSRRRRAIQDPIELRDKAHERYPLTTTRVGDYREDPQLVRFLERSLALREVVAGADPARIEVVRTDMDRAFQQPVLREIEGRSHNYYVLNLDSGARMHIHFFDFWRAPRPRVIDRIGRVFTPHEIGHYEVTGYRAAERTATWDPRLDTGLVSEFGAPRQLGR
jgi:hypothetical protein